MEAACGPLEGIVTNHPLPTNEPEVDIDISPASVPESTPTVVPNTSTNDCSNPPAISEPENSPSTPDQTSPTSNVATRAETLEDPPTPRRYPSRQRHPPVWLSDAQSW